MNIKSMFGIGLVSFGVAFAQDYAAPEAETYSAPAETSTNSYTATTTAPSMSEQELQKQEEQAASSKSLTAPVPFVKPDIPKESKRSSFNSILHGRSYNYNGNMAAANNTDLLMRYPNLFANRKFFYIEPRWVFFLLVPSLRPSISFMPRLTPANSVGLLSVTLCLASAFISGRDLATAGSATMVTLRSRIWDRMMSMLFLV